MWTWSAHGLSHALAYVTILDCFAIRVFSTIRFLYNQTTINYNIRLFDYLIFLLQFYFFFYYNLHFPRQIAFFLVHASSSFISLGGTSHGSKCPVRPFPFEHLSFPFLSLFLSFMCISGQFNWSFPIKYGMINNRNSDEASTSTCDGRWRVLPLSGRVC